MTTTPLPLFEGVPLPLQDVISVLFSEIDHEFETGTNPAEYNWMRHNCSHHSDPERIKRNLAKSVIEQYSSFVACAQEAALSLRPRGYSYRSSHVDTISSTAALDVFKQEASSQGWTVNVIPHGYNDTSISVSCDSSVTSSKMQDCYPRFQIPTAVRTTEDGRILSDHRDLPSRVWDRISSEVENITPTRGESIDMAKRSFVIDAVSSYKSLANMVDRITRYGKKRCEYGIGGSLGDYSSVESSLRTSAHTRVALEAFREHFEPSGWKADLSVRNEMLMIAVSRA